MGPAKHERPPCAVGPAPGPRRARGRAGVLSRAAGRPRSPRPTVGGPRPPGGPCPAASTGRRWSSQGDVAPRVDPGRVVTRWSVDRLLERSRLPRRGCGVALLRSPWRARLRRRAWRGGGSSTAAGSVALCTTLADEANGSERVEGAHRRRFVIHLVPGGGSRLAVRRYCPTMPARPDDWMVEVELVE